ncbi:MAG: RIP metalloprotease RseP [Anaerolineae bacterium]|nr:RIP metalloprotease RseP [Anaerolineae bacterium]
MLEFLVENNALATLVAFVLVLIPAIFIHEGGHFLAARAAGITILEFGIGFPPRACILARRGATIYTLNWLPIGGFVRPLGESFVHPQGDGALDADRRRLTLELTEAGTSPGRLLALNEARPLARILFMASGSAANMLTALLLFVLVGLSGIPTLVGGSAGIVAVPQQGESLWQDLRNAEYITQLEGEYFASTSDLLTRFQNRAGETLTLTVTGDGEEREVPVAVPDLAQGSQVYVVQVAPASPAEEAGLLPDDRIVGLNGRTLSQFSELQDHLQTNGGEELVLAVERGEGRFEVSLTPRLNPPEGQGAIGIGIVPAWILNGLVLVDGGWQEGIVRLSLPEALGFSLEQFHLFIRTLVNLPGQLLSGSLRPEETRLMSPLAISQVGGRFLQDSIAENQPYMILSFVALISIALGITNLLPLPALDGGRILFVLIELINGRPVSPEREGMVHLFGMVLLLSLMAVTVVNDLLNPVTALLP